MRARPGRAVADVALESAHRGVAPRAVDAARPVDLLVEEAAAAVLLEQPLASAPAHWSVFCFAQTSLETSSAGPAAQPRRTPGKNVFENVPACRTTSGPRLRSVGGASPS